MDAARQKLTAALFVYIVRPVMNAACAEPVKRCPCCGEFLQKYDDCGYVHIGEGDADCYGALSYGKGL